MAEGDSPEGRSTIDRGSGQGATRLGTCRAMISPLKHIMENTQTATEAGKDSTLTVHSFDDAKPDRDDLTRRSTRTGSLMNIRARNDSESDAVLATVLEHVGALSPLARNAYCMATIAVPLANKNAAESSVHPYAQGHLSSGTTGTQP
jgi:hypothetical protein